MIPSLHFDSENLHPAWLVWLSMQISCRFEIFAALNACLSVEYKCNLWNDLAPVSSLAGPAFGWSSSSRNRASGPPLP